MGYKARLDAKRIGELASFAAAKAVLIVTVLKRGLHGVYHHASAKHLFRYVDEFTFRLNEGNVARHYDAEARFLCG